ncbi:3-succinoylsemialdehyde-pyridine dehydrogenase [Sinobacterium norvegicum]|uniref:3-succinoylsemialdehyde-pyridine dehydrogenase n=1 Tax=Sinobacterium norvegicum TaxID=1641715 RepID=A0ABM9ACQ1_9GAMM|nr:aldehyde dehydrogenase family protein [Sinobacterium norvegicum]CAH0990961.1 3-succinoylsemialdehyde-pyridine dehydrogenase [Sinobacterium norvegicum]
MQQPDYGEARLYIDGELCAAEGRREYDNIAPATAKLIGRAADASIADADKALTAARQAFDRTAWSMDHQGRITALKKFVEAMRAEIKSLQDAMVAEAGSTRHNAETAQVNGPIAMTDWVIDYLEQFEWQRDLGEYTLTAFGTTSRRVLCREAVGVVAAITPWNFPLQIILAKIIPALAAGCTVVLKAAPDTPWTAALLGRIAQQSKALPKGVLNILTASQPADIGQFLSTDPRVDMVSFTGSTRVGREVMAAAAQTVKKVFLELGGKSPHIILPDADFGAALLNCLAVCYHAGQGCVLATRLLVPADRLAEVETTVSGYFDFITLGDPEAAGAIMGPLINRHQRQRVLSMIEQGVAEGARLIKGGGIPEGLQQGFYIEPTILVDEQGNSCVAQQEIFGPVLTIIPYRDVEHAITLANSSDYGLGAVINSGDETAAMAVAKRIRAGVINVNGGNFLAPDVPFGGYKQSGIGREMGAEGFAEYLETKTIAIGA